MSTFKPSPSSGSLIAPKLWLIDMDDTLYSASAGMFAEIDRAMTAYIEKELHMPHEEANRLRMHYWQKYGVTYYGLWKHHGIDPHHFLTATHKADTNSIHTQGRMREALRDLPGKKALFTNAPIAFAERVLRHLELQNSFIVQYRAEDMRLFGQWHPKPSAKMLRAIIARHGLRPYQCCLIDDNLNNLKTAKKVGMQTVLCKGWHHHGLSAVAHMDYVDATVAHIRDIVRLIKSPQIKKNARRKNRLHSA
mgnify:FL=1